MPNQGKPPITKPDKTQLDISHGGLRRSFTNVKNAPRQVSNEPLQENPFESHHSLEVVAEGGIDASGGSRNNRKQRFSSTKSITNPALIASTGNASGVFDVNQKGSVSLM